MATTGGTICIDFGNTRQKAAVFKAGKLLDIVYCKEDLAESILDLIRIWQPAYTILSSVINHPTKVELILQQHTNFHCLSPLSKLSFSTPVGKPETIGADRLALCSAAVSIFPGKNNLIIGLGTAVTYNFLNTRNEFLGGGISPGLYMRMKALNAYTAKLPIVSPNWNVPLVGYDTKTNIQSGVVLGLAHEIDGFIRDYQQKYSAFNVLLTGGDMEHLASHLKSVIFADPDLLFKGLYAICASNIGAS